MSTADIDYDEFAGQIADQVESYLIAMRAIAAEGDPGRAIPLLLLETSQISLAGARLGAQIDFRPAGNYQPDVGEEDAFEDVRDGLARILGDADTYSFVFDPYAPDVVVSQLSDDLTSVATDLDNGLRHFRAGDVEEALWWWQFSYVANWGNLAGAALNALLAIVSHDRLDADESPDADQVAAADEILAEDDPTPR